MPANTSAALSWFRKEDWEKWLQMDSLFEPDYDRWLAKMDTTEKKFKGTPVKLVKVTLDPDQFIAWSKSNNGGKLDSKSRAAYAAWLLSQGKKT